MQSPLPRSDLFVQEACRHPVVGAALARAESILVSEPNGPAVHAPWLAERIARSLLETSGFPVARLENEIAHAIHDGRTPASVVDRWIVEVPALGPTGQFPDGRVDVVDAAGGPLEDQGEIAVGISAQPPHVVIDFGRPIRCLVMNAPEARDFAGLVVHASGLVDQPITREAMEAAMSSGHTLTGAMADAVKAEIERLARGKKD